MKIKAIIALIAALAISATCTGFVLAEGEATPDNAPILSETAEVSEENTDAPEDIINESEEMLTSEKYSDETPILLMDRVKDEILYCSSPTAISEYVGQEFYYPVYGTDVSRLTVMYSRPSLDKTEETAYNSLQIEAHDAFIYFWIESTTAAKDTYTDENTVLYESHGTVFAINDVYQPDNPCSEGHYYAEGVIEGCCYSFLTDTIEDAKLVIDSLKK